MAFVRFLFSILSVRSTLFIIFLSATLLLLGNSPASGVETLTLGVHPYLPFSEIEQRYKPLADYISRQIGRPVRLGVGTNYQDNIDHIGRNEIDFAFLGPVAYVKVVERYGFKPLLARLQFKNKSFFQGKIVVRSESGIKSLKDLKNRSFAFGDPASTMSHLVPRHMLLEAGVLVEDMAHFDFLGSHHNVALGVLSGDYDAGAVKEEVFYEFAGRGLVELASTPRISEHVFVARDDLAPELIELLRSTLVGLKDSAAGRQIMSTIKKDMTAMVPAADSDYENLRQIIKDLNEHGIY